MVRIVNENGFDTNRRGNQLATCEDGIEEDEGEAEMKQHQATNTKDRMEAHGDNHEDNLLTGGEGGGAA